MFAFPVRAGRVTIGVLDLYRDTPGELTDEALPEAFAVGRRGVRFDRDVPA